MKTLLGIIVCSLWVIQSISAQSLQTKVKCIPYPLEVYNSPVNYQIDASEVTIKAEGKTNLFNNPNGKSNVGNAPMVVFEPQGDFTLSAKVTGELKAVYDVAALIVYQNAITWAKVCFEKSVQEEPTIVSVVTRNFSDDCNSEKAGNYAYLSVVRKGNEFSFFYSMDGTKWKMIRHFHLDTKAGLKTGFVVHGSRGDGFTGIFSDIKYQDKALDDMRELNL